MQLGASSFHHDTPCLRIMPPKAQLLEQPTHQNFFTMSAPSSQGCGWQEVIGVWTEIHRKKQTLAQE
jgi:hypothetical protein